MTQEEQRLYIHYINKLWHISQGYNDISVFSNFLKERKNELQLNFIDEFSDCIELIESEEDPNIYSIRIKNTNKDACHIPKIELKGVIE